MTTSEERAATQAEWKALLESMGNSKVHVTLGVLQYLDIVKETIKKRHAELTVRIEDLEARPVGGVEYAGVYDEKRNYRHG